mgnify:CR=1 FL=1
MKVNILLLVLLMISVPTFSNGHPKGSLAYCKHKLSVCAEELRKDPAAKHDSCEDWCDDCRCDGCKYKDYDYPSKYAGDYIEVTTLVNC